MAAAAAFEDIYQRVTDVAFTPVYFTLDSTTIGPAELGKVDAVAQHLAAMPTRVVVVEGHCDERGSNEYNMSLGESRAATVRDYLMRSGVAPERIQTRSYGEERPAVDGHDEGAWSRNRRGEFVLFQM
ncbi:MAG: OmpA family protein [Kiritimatiellae bacterium]|nr:OmpA family protein [Kiritimatiellia bacterium]